MQTDHLDVQSVRRLFEQVMSTPARIDILVNDIGGEGMTDWKPVWESSLAQGLALLDTAAKPM